MDPMKEMVIPFIENQGFPYKEAGSTLRFPVRAGGVDFYVRVSSQEYLEGELPTLRIVLAVTRVPAKETGLAISISNYLNTRGPGKFTIDQDSDLDFTLDMPIYSSEGEPDQFRRAFAFALMSVLRSRDLIMGAVYGGSPAPEESRGTTQDHDKRHGEGADEITVWLDRQMADAEGDLGSQETE